MTVEVALVAWALLVGVDWRVVTLIAVSLYLPVWALGAVFVHSLYNREKQASGSAVFCQSVARELRSGASLRGALTEASRAAGLVETTRLLEEGEPLGKVLPDYASSFPDIGSELAVVSGVAAETGVAAANLFDELGDLALAQIEMSEEVRVAAAPARASALVLVGLPTAYLGYQVGSGEAAELMADPVQRVLALVGIALVGAGLGLGILLIRRSF